MERITQDNGIELMRWKRGASSFVAWPTCGARLMSWSLELADGSEREVIHWPSDADLRAPAKVRGGNPILFPFVARTFAGTKEGFWKGPDKVVRPMPRHGFARDGVFEIESASPRGFCARLLPADVHRECYPFDYAFRVEYRFEELSTEVILSLENKDINRIPWCAGHHCYFTLPWHSGLDRKHYALHLPAKKAWNHGVDGKLIPVKDSRADTNFQDPLLIDCIHTHLKEGKVTFGPSGGEESVSLIINEGVRPDMWTAVTTWTEAAQSPFYCIEPWMGPPNAPSHEHGFHWVDPGETESFRIKISLE